MFTYSNKNWGKEPKPGELRWRIEIVSPVASVSENGYPETRDEHICACWAQVMQSGDSTNGEANATAQAGALNFAIRWREDIEPGMIVIFEGTRYEIVALGGFDFKKRYLGMKTVESRVIGL